MAEKNVTTAAPESKPSPAFLIKEERKVRIFKYGGVEAAESSNMETDQVTKPCKAYAILTNAAHCSCFLNELLDLYANTNAPGQPSESAWKGLVDLNTQIFTAIMDVCNMHHGQVEE